MFKNIQYGQTLTIESFSGSKHDFVITGVLKKPFKKFCYKSNDDNNNQFYVSSDNHKLFWQKHGLAQSIYCWVY